MVTGVGVSLLNHQGAGLDKILDGHIAAVLRQVFAKGQGRHDADAGLVFQHFHVGVQVLAYDDQPGRKAVLPAELVVEAVGVGG